MRKKRIQEKIIDLEERIEVREWRDDWKYIAYRCYIKYERLVDLLAIKRDKKNNGSE